MSTNAPPRWHGAPKRREPLLVLFVLLLNHCAQEVEPVSDSPESLCKSLESASSTLQVSADAIESPITTIRVTKAEVKKISLEGTDEIVAVRTKIVGELEGGGFADLTLFAFHEADVWPVVSRFHENQSLSSLSGLEGYAFRKTKYFEASRFPYEDHHIEYPVDSRSSGGRLVERWQNWSGQMTFQALGEIGCLSFIDVDLIFIDGAGSKRKVLGRIVANRTANGRMPWKPVFGSPSDYFRLGEELKETVDQ